MVLRVIEFMVGVTLAVLTLRDVFDTVVVPGESRGTLKVARRIVFATLPLWRRPGRRGVSTSFAPFALVTSFGIWISLLILGFGFMALALGSQFRPEVRSVPQALYVAGSGLVTVGLSGIEASGWARAIVLLAGVCGLAVMTLAVTYLLEVQGSIAQRDAGILELTTLAGEPPTGLMLLERYAELGMQLQIPRVLRNSRKWCASVHQSHRSHPTLIYFRSKGTATGWPAALGAVMDAALAVECLLDAPAWRGEAVLTREEGGAMALALIEVIRLRHEPQPPSPVDVAAFATRLARAGYRVRAHPDWDGFTRERGRHAACVSRMADHLGTSVPELVPPS